MAEHPKPSEPAPGATPPEDIEQLTSLARSFAVRGVVREELRRSAIDAAHFLGLAHLYAEKGENGRALQCLDVARGKDPANPGLHKLYGRIHYRRQEFARAAEELERALLYNPFERDTAELLAKAHYECRDMEPALRAAVHAFLLQNEGDGPAADRLRRRIRTLGRILGWGRRELTRVLHERQEYLHTAFDRLEWRRERFAEEEGALADGLPVALEEAAEASGRIELAARLRRCALWARLSDEQVFRLARAVHPEEHDSGSQVFSADRGRDLYLLEEGRVAIERATGYGHFVLGEIAPGDLLGEVSYICRHERTADAYARAPSRFLRIDAGELDALTADDPDLGVQVYWSLWRSLAAKLRATNDQLSSFFTGGERSENVLALGREPTAPGQRVTVEPGDKIKIFREQGLSRSELLTLATFSTERRFAEGAYIFQEGDEGDELYIVAEGRARISKYIPGGGEEALAILDRGDFFGEMSLIDGKPRSADARAHGGPLTVLALDQPTVHEALAMDSQASLEFLQLLCRLIAQRLREVDEKLIGWRILAGDPGAGRGTSQTA